MPTMRLSPASTEDYRLLAEKRLPRRLFDIIDGGSYYETTLRANSDDFRHLKLRQRVLRDVSDIDTSTTLFGHRWSMPVALAPTGMGGMMARRGEVMAKKAADLMGVPMCLSAMSICSMEEVAAVSDIPFWFQLYM
ncbi:alpha-hydroxy-acid oxidizing protein [Sphingorhabdus sp.]|jgi:L-lactate dehydrogenase (cytochrome)|uniref:alpha-hydroxy-acid oxidizing protein n=1 Tax=Sphingorhabdus sp. TaxID=1902408 RepID=UPI0037CACF12